ncbi:MAG: NAD-dependent epimerase/dehydratase family protein [Cyclobacteriaceae bacterium]
MIALTGATGLLGTFIARKLADEGFDLVCTKRDGSKISFDHPNIKWVEADILDPDALLVAFENVHTVIHAAALVSFHKEDAERLLKINVEGTANVVNCCLERGVKRLVHVSSVAALGRQKGITKTITEDHKWIDSPLNSDYAESKYLAELEVYRGHEEGLAIDIVNPSLILSQADWDQSSAQLFKYIWKQKPFYTDSFLNYVDVRDVAEIVHTFLINEATNARFIANGGTVPIKEIFQKIAVRFNRKPPWIKLSPSIIYFGAIAEGFLAWIRRQKPLVTVQSARSASDKFRYSNDKVINQFKTQFRPLNETLDWCCKYYLERATTNNQKVQV